MSAEWLNRYVALEKEDTYGVEPGVLTAITVVAGEGASNNVTDGTWTMTSDTGGKGAFGTCTTGSSGTIAMVITEGGQGYKNGDTFTYVLTGVGNLDVALNITEVISTTNGDGSPASDTDATINDSNGLTYGEVDDESFAQTFELLTRNDMSRQVASKAVTNTQYGEGSINLAVQPDDFVGKLLHSFLPATEEGSGFIDSVTLTTAGSGYTNGTYKLVPTLAIADATIDIANGDATVTCGSTASFAVGSAVTGTGIPANATIATITNSTTFELSATATADTTNVSNAVVTLPTPTEAAEIIVVVSGNAQLQPYITNPGKGYKGIPLIPHPTGSTNGALTAVMGAARKHVFNEPTLSTHAYPSYTIRVGRGNKEHTFTGMVASKLSMSANLNEYVMSSVDFVGKNEETPSTLVTNVAFAGLAVDALHFADAEVFFQDNQNKTVKVQQISFEININRDLDSAYAVGNRSFTRAPPTQTREITGTMEFNEVIYSDTDGYINEPTYTQLTGSSVHKIQPGAGKDAIRIKFASESGDDSLEFKFYNVRFEAPQASVSGRDANRMSVAFQAFYDATDKGAAKAIEAKLVGSGSHIQDTAYDA